MKTGISWLLAVVVAGGLSLEAFAAAAPPITFDDLLNAETLGTAEFSPGGKWLVFTRSVPATRQPSWGYEDPSRVRTRLFVGKADGSGVREIVGPADTRYSFPYSTPWSPDGTNLLLIAAKRESYGLAAYNLATGALTSLPGRTRYSLNAWMPDGRILYPVFDDGVRQRDLYGSLLDGLDTRWHAAWNGHAPQVTVSTPNPVFPQDASPTGTLMLGDPKTGKAQPLVRADVFGLAASGDDRHIAVITAAESLPDAVEGEGRRSELQIYVLEDGKARLVRRFPDIDLSPYGSLSWSPSGKRLIFVGRPLRDAQHQPIAYGRDLHGGMRLYETDATGASPHLLSAEGLSHGSWDDLTVLPTGWLGERPIAIAAHHVAGAVAAAGVDTHTRLDYGQSRDIRFDLFAFDGKRSENLTAFAHASVNRFLVPEGSDAAYVVADGALWSVKSGAAARRASPDGTAVLGFGTDSRYPATPEQRAYYRSAGVERISLATVADGHVGRLVLDLATGRLQTLSPPGDIVATAPDQLTTISKSIETWTTTLHFNGANVRDLAVLNAGLKEKAVSPAEKFTFPYNGAQLTGWVVLPPGTQPGAKLPAIVSIYGGSVYGDQPPFYARTDMPLPLFSGQLWAAQGYAVIYPSTPLGAGADTDMMATLAGEATAAVDALAAKGIVDPARVGITGQSFGGFSTAAVLAERSDRFRAGVALAGVYDFIHGYGLRAMESMLDDDGNMLSHETFLLESGQSRFGKPFWEMPDAYIRNSPIFRVDKIDAPLLLLHGDLDLAVTGLSGAERLYNAMLRAGKTPTLVRYWGEGHVAGDDWAIRDQWLRMTTWFGHYVKGEKLQAR
ncbi:MAG: prolyl oligopeptidase family serine peptidase [Rhizomicrobium sp.]